MNTIHKDRISSTKKERETTPADTGFSLITDVIPDAILDIRYFSDFNFVGERIDSYEAPLAYLTNEALDALKRASDDLRKLGYLIKIYDAYRPQSAVDHFVRWAKDKSDARMKPYFYPDMEKSELFEKGFILGRSSHSRGSTVDLTIVDIKDGTEADMGCGFDFFGEISHSKRKEGLTEAQIKNRSILREAMTSNGFKYLAEEWWHFTLEDEPYPNTYFDFKVREY